MKTTSHRIGRVAHRVVDLLLCTAVAGFLAQPGQPALAAEAGADSDSSAPALALPAPAALDLVQSFRAPAAGSAAAKAAAQPRIGMHLVVRLAVVTLEAHPDSGDVRLALRSKLLKGSIAKTPFAVAVAWRF